MRCTRRRPRRSRAAAGAGVDDDHTRQIADIARHRYKANRSDIWHAYWYTWRHNIRMNVLQLLVFG
jgi:hypothetical protein